jgi:3-hydroxyacyl-CoA dehydrogenase
MRIISSILDVKLVDISDQTKKRLKNKINKLENKNWKKSIGDVSYRRE